MAHQLLYPDLLKSRNRLQAPDFSSSEEEVSPEHNMPFSSVLFGIVALLLLQEAFLEAAIKRQTVVEGQDLDFHCVVAGDDTSALQWSAPHEFVIFLNHQRGLKDKRYKLINSSKDQLSIRLSNITTDDEGLYTCHHYVAVPAVTIKRVNVTVLAAPSKLLLEELTEVLSGEEKIILRCSTWDSKPPPQITWLLDNGIELFGDTQHRCEDNGKKCNATSTLSVHTFSQNATVTCVVRHKALRSWNLTAAVRLTHNIQSTTHIVPNTSEFGTTTVKNPWHYTDNILNVTEGNFRTERLSPSSKADTPNSTTTDELDNTFSTTEGNFVAHTTSASNETMNQNPNSTSGSAKVFNITQRSSRTDATPTSGKAGTLNFTATNKPDNILNVTERNSSAPPPSPSSEGVATLNSNVTGGINLTPEGIVMKPSKLFPILVAALLSVLFVAVLLFSVKLWKAHREWKKENDSSDVTIESYKARPNEDNHVQENRHVVGWKSSMKRTAEGSWRTSSKNSEESNGSVFEKQLPCIRETDL